MNKRIVVPLLLIVIGVVGWLLTSPGRAAVLGWVGDPTYKCMEAHDWKLVDPESVKVLRSVVREEVPRRVYVTYTSTSNRGVRLQSVVSCPLKPDGTFDFNATSRETIRHINALNLYGN